MGAVDWFVSANVSAQLVQVVVSVEDVNAEVSWLISVNADEFNVRLELCTVDVPVNTPDSFPWELDPFSKLCCSWYSLLCVGRLIHGQIIGIVRFSHSAASNNSKQSILVSPSTILFFKLTHSMLVISLLSKASRAARISIMRRRSELALDLNNVLHKLSESV